MDGIFLPPGLHLMGPRGVDIRKETMMLGMPLSAWLCNSFGVLNGGAIAYLAVAAIILARGQPWRQGVL